MCEMSASRRWRVWPPCARSATVYQAISEKLIFVRSEGWRVRLSAVRDSHPKRRLVCV